MLTTTSRWKLAHSKLSLLKKLKLPSYWLENGKKNEKLQNSNESSKLQFSMTTDAAPNVNKRFTALNFIISVQYKTNIYTVLYCADYISYPWYCTVLHWRKFRIQKLFCFVLNLYEWTATALNCTDMFEYKSALYCFVLGAVNPVPRRSSYRFHCFCSYFLVPVCKMWIASITEDNGQKSC